MPARNLVVAKGKADAWIAADFKGVDEEDPAPSVGTLHDL